jgi:predicted metal-dependent enzyme (double-stranded beta helix superfamily)
MNNHDESDGVVQRRGLLAVLASGCLAAGAPLALARRAQAALEADNSSLTYDEFLTHVIPIAKELVADNSRFGQDRYLFAIASFAVRLEDVARPEMRDGQGGPATKLGVNEGGDPFNVLHWELQPGAIIRVHPHLYGNVVTVGLEGEVEVTNYEFLDPKDVDSTEPIVIRRTLRQVLRKGEINLVNLDRNSMHGFVAGQNGARGLDITTRIREKRPTPSLEIDEQPRDAARGLYGARLELKK